MPKRRSATSTASESLGAGKATSAFYNGLSESNITRWKDAEDEIRRSLMHENRVDQVQGKKSAGKMASSFSSKGARIASPARSPSRQHLT